MYGIGTVARLAQVSVRTLRHYDDLGLLKPAHVDPLTGYRYYTPDQVLRLHRILVLRDLGVPLSEVGQLIDDDVTVEQLRGILRLRQAEACARLAAQTEQLTRVEIRLAQLEEGSMAAYEVIVKRLEPLRVVALSEDLAGFDEIGEACRPHVPAAARRPGAPPRWLSWLVARACTRTQVTRTDRFGSPPHCPVPSGVTIDGDGLTTIELPAVERAATTVVRGAPDKFPTAFRALHEWIERSGDQATSFERELYIDCDGPRDTWVTELQAILEPRIDLPQSTN